MGHLHQIEIRRLRVTCHIGVPDEERALPQHLLVTVRATVSASFHQLEDQIGRTLDYAELATSIQDLASCRPRHLVETLAADIAGLTLCHDIVTSVEVTVEKHILPDTECVAVHLRRDRGIV
ncbi:dihydroneopterin aldolase [Luteolibacter flavescens]|uniref:dihydroneopterin aldolase n=1 Tax=Luteolibacter flavescens TaxID=1859460 RepID=A0ABT3FPF5_9BACT|nr:dihydroneopterin aldolase [Luteolibacter flavescens]MCW1885451.1 dihydroneopterin aldolase [Luteolibacter flavescens]